MFTEFIENRLAIDIKGCSKETAEKLQEFFNVCGLEATWYSGDDYVLNTIETDWLYIVYEENTTLNGRKISVNYDGHYIPSVKAADFLANINRHKYKIELQEDELQKMFT